MKSTLSSYSTSVFAVAVVVAAVVIEVTIVVVAAVVEVVAVAAVVVEVAVVVVLFAVAVDSTRGGVWGPPENLLRRRTMIISRKKTKSPGSDTPLGRRIISYNIFGSWQPFRFVQ